MELFPVIMDSSFDKYLWYWLATSAVQLSQYQGEWHLALGWASEIYENITLSRSLYTLDCSIFQFDVKEAKVIENHPQWDISDDEDDKDLDDGEREETESDDESEYEYEDDSE